LDFHGNSAASLKQDFVAGGLMHDITGWVAREESSQHPAATGAQYNQVILSGKG
jgi:hypothetical protein